jgi:hypothetical protein
VRTCTKTPGILYISPHWPEHAASASELRAKQIARALEHVGRVDVVRVDGEVRPNTRIADKINWVMNARITHPHGLAIPERDRDRIVNMTQRADMLWFFKLRTANLFDRWRWPRSVVDIDDVPSAFERSAMNNAPSAAKGAAAAVRYWSWRRRERLVGERFTVAAVCSDADKRYLQTVGTDAPVHVIPNGFERPQTLRRRQTAGSPRIGFIGVLDHQPNLDGIRWFVRNCWPAIKREEPGVRLRLVGRYTDGPLRPRGVDVDGLGWLADPADEIATWSAMVVPVLEGAGTRGKIAHAFSQKCPIVSTSLGAYGYDPQNGRDMLLADSADAFASACVLMIRQPAVAAAMAERAWTRFLETWTWDAIAPKVWAAAEDCMRRSADSC